MRAEKKIKKSLKTKIIITVLTVNMALSALFIFTVFRLNSKLLTNESRRTAQVTLSGLANRIESFIEAKAKVSWSLARNPFIREWLQKNEVRLPDPERDPQYNKIISFLLQLKEEDEDLSSVFLASEKTQMYYEPSTWDLPEDYRIGTRPWYIRLKEEGIPHYVVLSHMVTGLTYVTYYEPVFSPERIMIGACGVDIGIEQAGRFIQEMNPFEKSLLFLVNEDGQVIYHPQADKILRENIRDYRDDGKRFSDFQALIPEILKGNSIFAPVIFDGLSGILISEPISRLGFRLVLVTDRARINAPLKAMLNLGLLVSLLSLTLLLVVLLLSINKITQPLRKLTGMVSTLAHGEGDLRKRLDLQSNDELGELASELNYFIASLQEIISHVQENTETVSSSAYEFSSTTEELAATAEQQSIQSQRVNESVKKLAATSERIAQSVAFALNKIEQSSKLTAESDQVIRNTIEALQIIQNNAEQLRQNITELNRSADEINTITEVITEVADHTNLLALNAAIESARAGDAGRGFAVVADEVRKLAERTANSTREIAKIVGSLQSGTINANNAMEKVTSELEKGRLLSQNSLNLLTSIVSLSSEIMNSSQQIVNALQDENYSIEEINENIDAITISNKESTNAMRNLAETAENLSTQAEKLQTQIKRFKT